MMRFRNLLCALAFVVLQTTSFASPSLKVGFIMPLTGSGALMGKSIQGVTKLAQLNSIEPVFEDDQCTGKHAVSAYLKLRQQGIRVYYMTCSGSILAVAPLVKKNEDLILTTYAGSTKIRDLGAEVIRLNPDATSIAEAFPAVLSENLRPIAVLHEEQDYALSLAEKLQEILGKEAVKLISYQSDATSIKPQILRAKGSKVKSIALIPVSDATARIALKEMSELKVGLPIFGEVNLCDYPFKPSDFGLSGLCLSAQFEGKEFDNFLERFTENMGYPPSYPFYDAMALDLLQHIDKIGRSDQTEVAALRQSILSGFEGSFAKYALTPTGEARNSEQYLKKITY